MSRKTAREDAFKLLFSMEVGNHTALEALDSYFSTEGKNKYEFSLDTNTEDDKAYVRETITGVFDNLTFIDDTINRHSPHWKTDRLSKVTLAVLRLAVYEITMNRHIPSSVSAKEAVRLSNIYGSEKDRSFVNGILGEIIKEIENA